jgi:hypothetical protein
MSWSRPGIPAGDLQSVTDREPQKRVPWNFFMYAKSSGYRENCHDSDEHEPVKTWSNES